MHAPGELLDSAGGEDSRTVAARVLAAHARQLHRQGKPNASLSGQELQALGAVQADAMALLADTLNKLLLSARAFHRLLRVARTIADLEASPPVGREHVLQAVQLRRHTWRRE